MPSRLPTPTRFLLALVLAAPAAPYVGDQSRPPGPWFGGRPDPVFDVWRSVDELAAAGDAGWAGFQERFGAGWRVRFSTRTLTPDWIIGPGLDLGGPISADDRGVAAARSLLEPHLGLLGGEHTGDLVLDRASRTRNPYGQESIGIAFRQVHEGLPVRLADGDAQVLVVLNGTLGRVAAIHSRLIRRVDVETPARYPLEAVVADAWGGTRAAAASILRAETFVLARGPADVRLVHEVEIVTVEPPHRWVHVFDAHTGQRLETRDDLVWTDVVGTVRAGSWDDGPHQSFSAVPMDSLRVTVSGGNNGYTDAAGFFRITHGGSGGVTITGRFFGRHASVTDASANGNLTFSRSATPGTPASVVLNPTHVSELETAEATAYRMTTGTHYFIQARYPSFAAAWPNFPVRVNVPQTCNAYFDGTGMTFFRSGGLCNNTAFEEIVAHEYGHAFHQWFHGAVNPLSFSEGIADHIGIYWSSRDNAGNPLPTNREMGRGFWATGASVRDYRPGGPANHTQWPPGPMCANEPHCMGQCWAGFCADLRDNLVGSLGLASGADVAENITISAYALNPFDMDAGVLDVFLKDDDDGNLTNGTPHFSDLAAAADRHALPRPPNPVFVAFTHSALGPTRDVVNARTVTVTARGLLGRTVTSVDLLWGTGGSFLTVPMTGTGQPDEWRAALPPQNCGTTVFYRFRARTDRGETGTLPEMGDFSYRVARVTTLFFDDFEGGAPGWTHQATRGVDDWALGPPNPSGSNIFDPRRAYSGNNVYGTDLAAAGSDGNYPDLYQSRLDSPPIDARGHQGVRLSFARALTVEEGQFDQALVYATVPGRNPLLVWSNPFLGSFLDAGWGVHDYPIGIADQQAGVTISFLLVSDTVVNFGGWNVDDVKVYTESCNVAALRSTDPTPAIGSPFLVTLTAQSFRPYVVAFGLYRGTSSFPGVADPLELAWPFTLFAVGTLDAGGLAMLPARLPVNPGLVGLPIHLQAFVQTAALNIFSNVLTVVGRAP